MRLFRMRTFCFGLTVGEICRLFFTFMAAFYIRPIFDETILRMRREPLCLPCLPPPTCPVPTEASIKLAPRQFRPRTRFEVIRYEYFDELYLYSNIEDDPRIGLHSYHKKEIRDSITIATEEINKNITSHSKWVYREIINGYRRMEPEWGMEYILDLSYENAEFLDSPRIERFYIVKPFHTAIILPSKYSKDNEKINFILPTSSVNDRLQLFLTDYENACLKSEETVNLILVVQTGSSKKELDSLQEIKSIVSNLQKKYPKALIRIIEKKEKFSRATALDMVARQLSKEALLFFCDVDVILTKDFLRRCRKNTILGQQVYYPIVFSQYNPDIVQQFTPKGKIKVPLEINKYTGHWIHYGYGMVCLYNQDYQSVGGYDTKIISWGGEDVDLYQKHVNSNLKIFRAMDPTLIHRYHSKTCEHNLVKEQYEACIGTLVNSLGGRMQLAKALLMQNRTLYNLKKS